MATSEPLVGTGQPYGQRQATVSAMRRADIPLNIPPKSPGGTAGTQAPPPVGAPSSGGPVVGADLLRRTTPGDFPFITDSTAEPIAQPTAEPDSPMQALAGSAQSSFALAVLSRLNRR